MKCPHVFFHQLIDQKSVSKLICHNVFNLLFCEKICPFKLWALIIPHTSASRLYEVLEQHGDFVWTSVCFMYVCMSCKNVMLLGQGGPLIADWIQEVPAAVLVTTFCFHASHLKTQKLKCVVWVGNCHTEGTA